MGGFRTLLAASVLVVPTVVWGAPAHGSTLLVTNTADGDDTTCDEDCSLREAVAFANANPGPDLILLPAGIYTLVMGGGAGDLDILSEITIEGSGHPTITAADTFTQRIFDLNPTGDLTLKGLTVSNGRAVTAGEDGGGIRNAFGRVTLQDVTMSGNVADDLGGAIYNAGTLLVRDSTFSANDATFGGAVYSFDGNNTFLDDRFLANTAGTGGAIVFQGDETTGTTINESVFYGNSANSDDGGAIANIGDGDLNIFESTFERNEASDDGGGIATNGGPLNIEDTTLMLNETGDDGGGLAAFAGAVTSIDSTFSRNTAGLDGGGIYNDGGALDVRFTTVADNFADEAANGTPVGGGIRHLSGSIFLKASVVANNTDQSGVTPVHDCAAPPNTVASGGANVYGLSNQCADVPDFSVADPGLDSLGFNGGATQTHPVQNGSPARDVLIGSDPDCVGSNDQREAARSGNCDAGSYELVFCRGFRVNVVGTGRPDLLQGTNGDDGIIGGAGKDQLFGNGGNDGLCGQAGRDKLFGGDGDDALDGGTGADKCRGQAGVDTFKSCETRVQ